MRKQTIFDKKRSARCYGKTLSDGSYWVSDGHFAYDHGAFSARLDVPAALSDIVSQRQNFRSEEQKTVELDRDPPDIERIIPKGPRYILTDTRLDYKPDADGKLTTRALCGHDRVVFIDKAFLPLITAIPVNLLQNYDQPTGAIAVYLQSDDHETTKPIAVIMPIRNGHCGEAFFTASVAMMQGAIERGNSANNETR